MNRQEIQQYLATLKKHIHQLPANPVRLLNIVTLPGTTVKQVSLEIYHLPKPNYNVEAKLLLQSTASSKLPHRRTTDFEQQCNDPEMGN